MKGEKFFTSPLTMRSVVIQQPPVRVEQSVQDKKTAELQRYASPSTSKPDSPQRRINPISRSRYGNSR
ncbi:MAG: hypothetical protein KBC00_04435 [Candidatus Levybacteria bacterium]|nr:hypothetical protein [Candidatus Levybacteria bacterium]MBP9815114.1 hypothetical protein [Candidatus Levybacteria bacterium]